MLSFALACARAVVFGRTVDRPKLFTRSWIDHPQLRPARRLKIGGQTLYHTYTVYSVASSVV
jgi:hypothetical protein